jgi:hypothetical protein
LTMSGTRADTRRPGAASPRQTGPACASNRRDIILTDRCTWDYLGMPARDSAAAATVVSDPPVVDERRHQQAHSVTNNAMSPSRAAADEYG